MKRLLTIITVFLICTMLTLITALALVRSSKVQTAVVGVLTDQLGNALHTRIDIGKVDIRMPGNLLLESLYLEDQSGDTLLYVPQLEVRFNPFAIEEHRLDFRLIRLVQPYVCLRQDSASTNADFLLRAFTSTDSISSQQSSINNLSLDRIEVTAARLRYTHIPSHTDFCVNSLDARLRLPLISKDSLLASLDQLSIRASVPSMDLNFTTSLHGTLDTLYADNLEVNYRSTRLLLGDASIIQPLVWDSMLINIACQDLYARPDIVENLLSDILHTPQHLPASLRQLGTMHYRGELSGRLANLRLHGAFRTRLGTVTTNLRLSIQPDFSLIRYSGRVATQHFALARLLDNEDFNRITTSINVEGVYQPDAPINAQGELRISEFDFRSYHYSDLTVLGSLRDSVFHGSVDIQDPALDLHVAGTADFHSQQPLAQLALRLEHLRLNDLHINSDFAPNQDLALSCHVSLMTDGQGKQIADKLYGSVQIDSLYFINGDADLFMRSLELSLSQSSERDRQLRLLSDFVSGAVTGSFTWSSLPRTFQRIAHSVMPTFVPQPVLKDQPNDVNFYLYVLHADTLLHALGREKQYMPRRQTIKGFIHESTSQYALQAYVPAFESGNSSMRDMTMSLTCDNSQASLALSMFQHTLDHDSTKLILNDLGIYFTTIARNDSLLTQLRFGEVTTDHASQSDIQIHTHLTRYRNQPLIQIHTLPSHFFISDTLWTIAESTIEYNAADTMLAVNHFDVTTATQFLRVNGLASTRATDSIRVEMDEIELHSLLRLIELEKALDVQGRVSGWATLYSLFSSPMFEANLFVPNAYINSAPLGDITATATLDKNPGLRSNDTEAETPMTRASHPLDKRSGLEPLDSLDQSSIAQRASSPLQGGPEGASTQATPGGFPRILLAASAVLNDRTIAKVTGHVEPEKPYWEIDIAADSVPLNLVTFWTGGILDDVQGTGYGNVHVFGRKMKTWVTTSVLAQDASFVLPFTGARYYFTDTIALDTSAINFDHLVLHDAQQHTATLSGAITHELFQDFNLDLHVDCDRVLALDLPYDPQSLYYGRVYATGHVDVTGSDKDLNVDVAASTCGNSDFYLSIATASSAKDNSFITFVEPSPKGPQSSIAQRASSPLQGGPKGASTSPPSGGVGGGLSSPQQGGAEGAVTISLAIDATPDVAVHLVMDPHNGDGIVARGEGALRLVVDEDDVSLVGTYTLQSGILNYTLANLVKRDFSIERGSTIVWSGVPEDPILNVKAIYRLTASLKDLFGSDAATIATNRNSVPVNCIIYLSDKLTNPLLKFGIELPQSDESVNQQVMSIINTEEMLMRQVIYLLVFNRFFTPEYLRKDATSTGLNETYSFLSSTVTGQINSWLSKLTDIFSMGIAIRADVESGNAKNNEYEANFQINPVKRLTINGNFGYRSDDLSNRPFFGDLDIEYQLTPDGKLRAKAYTHTVDKYSLKQANTVQGIGFIIRHDFNWGDARRKRQAKQAAQAAQAEPSTK